MSETPVVVYLEADDEVTAVVRRIRAAEPGPIVIVAPGRSRATSSVVTLRLLGRAADAEGRALSVVGDALTRSLSAEAGVPAFRSLDDARAAEGVAPAEAEPRHAAINVVRGPATDETAPTMAAAATPAAGTSPDDLTRPVTIPSPPRKVAVGRRPGPRMARRPRSIPSVMLIAVAMLLVAGVVAGATLLPAASVAIVPRSEDIGPIDDEIRVSDAERSSGTERATVEVVASGTYVTQEPASGTVVLFNWTFFPVEVPAGTFVAAGEQAFATQANVTVPRGQLTAAGTIAAGDIPVAVVAAAPGPAGNVAAEAIDTVVNQGIDARLRGFPENPEPRVLNPDPTAGGLDETGSEINQSDVDAALDELRQALAAQVADAMDSDDPNTIVVPVPGSEPRIEVPEDLVGRRDEERVALDGELDWEVVRTDEDLVVTEARSRLEADATLLADGHELVPDSVEVTLRAASLVDGVLTVPVEVTARSVARIDVEAVRARIVGRSADEAAAALSDLGSATVDLWPGWVGTVPGLEWRVDVRVEAPAEVGG